MSPFRPKKADDELEVKDLKPKNRRKRKEPPKPWSHKERIFIFLVFLFTIIMSIIFAVRARDSKLSSLAPQIVNTTNFIKTVVPKSPADITVLKSTLESKLQSLDGTYSIWIEDVGGNFTLGLSQNSPSEGASLFKLPLILAYFDAVDTGVIDPSNVYYLKNSDKISGSGSIANLPPGSALTYKDLIEAMGKNSDNTAFQIMGNILGWSKIPAVIQDIGMTDTDFNNSTTTAYDIGLLFSKLTKGNVLSSASKAEFLRVLTGTSYEDYLPAGVPDDIKVAHKFGTAGDAINDAGIIYAPKPYILVIMAHSFGNDDPRVTLPEISRLVFDWATK